MKELKTDPPLKRARRSLVAAAPISYAGWTAAVAGLTVGMACTTFTTGAGGGLLHAVNTPRTMNPYLGRPIEILLVEDSPSDAQILRESLAQTGDGQFDFTHVESWADATPHLQRQQFDVMLLDLSLPDASGMRMIETIRVRAIDRSGKPVAFEASGFHARVLQHEIDHLDGLVYLDRMRDMKSLAYTVNFG